MGPFSFSGDSRKTVRTARRPPTPSAMHHERQPTVQDLSNSRCRSTNMSRIGSMRNVLRAKDRNASVLIAQEEERAWTRLTTESRASTWARLRSRILRAAPCAELTSQSTPRPRQCAGLGSSESQCSEIGDRLCSVLHRSRTRERRR